MQASRCGRRPNAINCCCKIGCVEDVWSETSPVLARKRGMNRPDEHVLAKPLKLPKCDADEKGQQGQARDLNPQSAIRNLQFRAPAAAANHWRGGRGGIQRLSLFPPQIRAAGDRNPTQGQLAAAWRGNYRLRWGRPRYTGP